MVSRRWSTAELLLSRRWRTRSGDNSDDDFESLLATGAVLSYPTICAFQAIVIVPQALLITATGSLILGRRSVVETTVLLGRDISLTSWLIGTSHQSVDPSPVARSDLDEWVDGKAHL